MEQTVSTFCPFYEDSIRKMYDIDETAFVSRYLNNSFVEVPLASVFMYTLKDARTATGREPWTGEIINDKFKSNDETYRTGQITYLILIEQIGRCFRTKAASTPRYNYPLYKALHYFANGLFTDDEMMGLVALRHAFAHNYYSAVNINTYGVEHPLNRVFNVTAKPGLPVLKLGVPWDGNLNYSAEHISVFNPIAFCETVERLVFNLRSHAANGELEIALRFGLMELKKRFVVAMVH